MDRPAPRAVVLLAACLCAANEGDSRADDPPPPATVSLTAAAEGALSAPARRPPTPPTVGPIGGFDLNLTAWGVSGLDTAPGAYESQLTLIVEPRFHVGRWIHRAIASRARARGDADAAEIADDGGPGSWWRPLFVSARFLASGEFAGNDVYYRGARFGSPAVLGQVPETVAVQQIASPTTTTPYGVASGAERRAWISDLWISALHPKVYRIPVLKIDLQLGARVILPTSPASRAATMVAAPSVFTGADVKLWRFHLEYGFRFVKYFHDLKVMPVVAGEGTAPTVMVNGQSVTPERLASTGVTNPDYGFIHFFDLAIELPKGFSLDFSYALFNTVQYGLTACGAPRVAGADVCADGRLVGDARSTGQRDNQWFLAEVGYQATDYLSLGLGLSTYGPVRNPDGGLANPFISVSRDNYSSAYLSVAFNTESLVERIKGTAKGAGQSAGVLGK